MTPLWKRFAPLRSRGTPASSGSTGSPLVLLDLGFDLTHAGLDHLAVALAHCIGFNSKVFAAIAGVLNGDDTVLGYLLHGLGDDVVDEE